MAYQTKLIPSPATFFAWYKIVIALYALPPEQITQIQLGQRIKLYELLLADCLSTNPVLGGITRLRAIGTLKMLDSSAFDRASEIAEKKKLIEQQAALDNPTTFNTW